MLKLTVAGAPRVKIAVVPRWLLVWDLVMDDDDVLQVYENQRVYAVVLVGTDVGTEVGTVVEAVVGIRM